MKRFTRLRSAIVVMGAASLLASTAITAGASTFSGKFNAADAGLVPAVYKGTTLQVATDASYPPDESMKGTTMVGFDVDFINAVATTLGIKVKENNVTFDNIIGGIEGGRYQIGNSSFTDTKKREKQVNFVDYFQAGEGVYELHASKFVFRSLASFCGNKVAVETGTTEQSDAKAVKCSGGKKVTVLSFPTQTEANSAVQSGQAIAGFVDSQVAGYIVSLAGGVFKLTGKPVNVFPYGIATPKSTDGLGLAKAIRAATKTLIANGTYGAILKKWGVTSGALTGAHVILNGAKS
jgi:polar amino acid transport system substrate-binding protein